MKKSDEGKVRAWVEEHLGGRVTACERQPRWRPAWFLTVEKDGRSQEVYFRGDRGISDAAVYALEHEMACLTVLEAEGIPVPHVFGFCTAPRGILMERSPGRADLSTAKDEAERRSVGRHYMEILARMHALDIAPFLDAGLKAPANPDQLALADLPLWERGYRRAKKRPEPLIEFGLRWLKRNIPAPAGEACFVCGDSGQFLFDEGRITAILDLELAHLGDPAEDLGALRCRDLSEPLGPLAPWVADYEAESGRRVDRRLIDYHTVRFALSTPLAIVPVLATARPGVDLIQYLCWYHVYSRAPLEIMAHAAGITLEAPDLPSPTTDGHTAMHEDLCLRLAPGRNEGDFDHYDGSTAYRTAVYLQRRNQFGAALADDDIADINDLLGIGFTDLDEAVQALEAHIIAAGPDADADADIMRLLYRRALRQELLLEPVLAELSGARIQLTD